MKYKALMIDLDGTTVPHFSDDVSDRVKNAILQAHSSVSVSLVTGRPLSSTHTLIEKLEITGPCVVLNGAQIYDPKQKKVINQLFLTPQDTHVVYNTLLGVSENIMVHDGQKDVRISDWKELEQVVSFYLYDVSPELVQQISKKFERYPTVTTNRMLGSKPGVECIEVIHEQATKQFGIYKVANLLGIETHEIIGVGDGYNDFPLLMACGLKVAMGNAVPELKTIADFIAPPVEEDGLATVIEKCILEK